ncbi:hypothetical protein GCM10020227_54850 [Streptomyces flavovirens]
MNPSAPVTAASGVEVNVTVPFGGGENRGRRAGGTRGAGARAPWSPGPVRRAWRAGGGRVQAWAEGRPRVRRAHTPSTTAAVP